MKFFQLPTVTTKKLAKNVLKSVQNKYSLLKQIQRIKSHKLHFIYRPIDAFYN